jgi:hypothetical protein
MAFAKIFAYYTIERSFIPKSLRGDPWKYPKLANRTILSKTLTSIFLISNERVLLKTSKSKFLAHSSLISQSYNVNTEMYYNGFFEIFFLVSIWSFSLQKLIKIFRLIVHSIERISIYKTLYTWILEYSVEWSNIHLNSWILTYSFE